MHFLTPISKYLKILLSGLLFASYFISSAAFAEDNDELQTQIDILIAAHNFALPTALTPLPGVSDVAEAVVYGTNIGLKYVKAPFDAPADTSVMPNSPDLCSYTLTMPQTKAEYGNLLGIWDTRPLPNNWGPLGAPYVKHANTEVEVEVRSLNPDLLKAQTGSQSVVLPAGNHVMKWQAHTQLSIPFDYVLPVVIYGLSKIKYSKALFGIADNSAAQASKQAKIQEFVGKTLINIGIELELIAADMATSTGKDNVTHSDDRHLQTLTVFDVRDPLISTQQPAITLEATDFGGALYSRSKDDLFATIQASDPCGREYSLFNDAPFLLPLGETTLTWSVLDRGPNESFTQNSAQLQQSIIVEDTQAPIMVPPAGKVIEVNGTGQSATEVMLGMPRVVDLADASPQVSSNAPDFFPVNSRTAVVWQTEDASGNSSEATQWITIKQTGANNAPTADAKSSSTLTSQPVDIILTGSDPDFLDGRFDPLSFFIDTQPQNGEFIAPLLPYFIEDYRTQPAGPFGEEFLLSNNRSQWVYNNYCRNNIDLPWDFVYRPKFIQVTDDGTQFITDWYWFCNPSNAQTEPRVSKWDKNGNYLGQDSISDNTFDNFVLDRDGHIYYVSSVGAGSSTSLFLSRCSTDFGTNNTDCDRNWKFNYASAPSLDPNNLVYARVDSQRGIAFVTDKRRVFAFDIRGDNNDSEFLGVLKNDEQFLSSCSAAGISRAGFTIEIDSNSNLYITDSCADQIHKFKPSVLTADGTFIPGDYIGWLGKCDSSTNNACDIEKRRSKGYSCTDETCSINSTGSSQDTAGDGQGQLNTPMHIALDPNDILYVADYANQRIQRFSPDGTFVGEAESTGTGINMGDEPSFILGNFDSPKTVSVNSTQFFIVDQAESFVHVFETTPLKDITDDSATVTYVSDFSFHSAVDSFTYYVSDGLADSAPVSVDVSVSRNFRPPEVMATSYDLIEDGELVMMLEGDDPDGVIGTGDFNALDILTYEISTPPEHGSITGAGNTFVYKPNADYHGEDSFEFIANDQVLVSKPAKVDLSITSVNDPPVFALPDADDIGIGFPFSLIIQFTDDVLQSASDIQHTVEITWGDGSSDNNDSGVMVLSPSSAGVPGLVTASHVYQSTGIRTLRVCITDGQGAQSCENKIINLSEKVHLEMAVETSSEEVSVGNELDYEISVVNLAPDIPGNGMAAENVVLSHKLPDELTLMNIDSPDSSCTQQGNEIACDLGQMESGAAKTFSLTAMNNGNLLFDTEGEYQAVAMTTSTATRDSYLG
ncbi:MAG: Ig-like domain-containing protein, partial [Pseudomonadota bacterium]